MFGTSPEPEGITNPPIDELLKKIGSKYELSVLASQRARQIVEYRQEMARGDGNVVHYGPLVPADPDEKPLSIALREIAAGKLEWTVGSHGALSPEEAQAAERAEDVEAPATAVPAPAEAESVVNAAQDAERDATDSDAAGVSDEPAADSAAADSAAEGSVAE
ncbi:DNA-directed RNA polymerase subunit omega [Neoactinobaculum massilliense]|uniref:DNA-directed RNA polymerase subunit omega n=1 Tax=Neoactinobaculum massilliense TaxID=2364794 RepID=UPI000F52027C|nr:DNA-directed RNA polymerase subunit omega [Neoactinobaculum massilliense]